MKQFFVLFALLSATAAHATTVKIDTVDAYYQPGTSSMSGDVSLQGYRFQVKADLGRARINVLYTSNYIPSGDDGYSGPSDSLVMVNGLSFDAAASQVVFKNAAGKTTNCADVTLNSGIFHRTKIKNTGLCTLTSSLEDVATDDGWEIKHHKVLNVFLNVQD